MDSHPSHPSKAVRSAFQDPNPDGRRCSSPSSPKTGGAILMATPLLARHQAIGGIEGEGKKETAGSCEVGYACV